MKKLINAIRVGFFLAWRQLKRSSLWSNVLITFIMTLTFLNLVVVSGILVGLIEGSSIDYRAQYSGDVLIQNLTSKDKIEKSQDLIRVAESYPEVTAITPRYIVSGVVEGGYKNKIRQTDASDEVGIRFVGIDPAKEESVTHLSDYISQGRYLRPTDEGKILVGSRVLKKYARATPPGEKFLEDADVGSRVRVSIDDKQKEVTIVGIVDTKIDEVSRRVYFVDTELRKWMGRTDHNVNEIAMTLTPGTSPSKITSLLKQNGRDQLAVIQTWKESQGQFFEDIANTFGLLGTMIGSIGLLVAAISIFIVIFVNAITRRKFIGILKGIGISGLAIEISYVLQSMFYALLGTSVGAFLVFTVIQPYFDANPIDFPFSDGILVATPEGALIRMGVLLISTVIAGYIPAKIVIRGNTLNAILGR